MIHLRGKKGACIRNIRSYLMGILLIILAFGLIACSAGRSKSFSGTWESPEWGTLEMEQKGSNIVGTYEYPSTAGRMYGQIEGTVDGDRLNVRWWQSTVKGIPYAEAPERGDAYFILAEDGDHISGRWRGENEQEWTGTWNFVRK